ncbi:MAG TPA: DUF3616 domain-containing protein [Rubrivivax sp.]
MPKTAGVNAVRLEFAVGAEAIANLSGVAVSDDGLWVAGDEASQVHHLRRLPPRGGESLRFGKARTFALSDLLKLPGAPDEEADIEGMAVADGYLWVVGSHGLKRPKIEAGRTTAKDVRRLAKPSLDGNCRLLARLPIEKGPDGQPDLRHETKDGRRALRLKGNAKGNVLTDLLADDPHLGPFMAIPGKDNGFDIEGLAANGTRLLLGLRGPVLRGWAVLLEIEVAPRARTLRLAPLDDRGTLLRKHFLPIDGLGVRDLHFAGDDLFILAGPTMALDGEIRIYKWSGARPDLAANHEPSRFVAPLEIRATVPHGRATDRAEAFCDLPQLAGSHPHWLVLYDAPGDARREGKRVVFGDLLRRG